MSDWLVGRLAVFCFDWRFEEAAELTLPPDRHRDDLPGVGVGVDVLEVVVRDDLQANRLDGAGGEHRQNRETKTAPNALERRDRAAVARKGEADDEIIEENTENDLRKFESGQRFFLSFFLVSLEAHSFVLTETQSRKESVAAATFTEPSEVSIPTPWRTNLRRRGAAGVSGARKRRRRKWRRRKELASRQRRRQQRQQRTSSTSERILRCRF